MIWCHVNLDYPPNWWIFETPSKKSKLHRFFLWCKMKKRNKNTSNQCALVCFTAQFQWIGTKMAGGWPSLRRCYTNIYWFFFLAVFARTREIDVRMIMPSEFVLPQAVFLWRKKKPRGVKMTSPLGLLGLNDLYWTESLSHTTIMKFNNMPFILWQYKFNICGIFVSVQRFVLSTSVWMSLKCITFWKVSMMENYKL